MMLLNTPAPSLPIGAILHYVGLLANIPTGWHICDGANGTIDMRDKFMMGGSHAQIGQTGGANSVTPAGSVSVNNHTLSGSQMPRHNHTEEGSGGAYNSGAGNQHSGSHGNHYNPVTNNTGYSGGSVAHNHIGSFSGDSQDNKPAFYQSAYIQRVA